MRAWVASRVYTGLFQSSAVPERSWGEARSLESGLDDDKGPAGAEG